MIELQESVPLVVGALLLRVMVVMMMMCRGVHVMGVLLSDTTWATLLDYISLRLA